jgi:hypothetical protein
MWVSNIDEQLEAAVARAIAAITLGYVRAIQLMAGLH